MEFSRQEYWRGLPFPSLQNLPHPGIKPGSPTFQADSLLVWATRKVQPRARLGLDMSTGRKRSELVLLLYVWEDTCLCRFQGREKCLFFFFFFELSDAQEVCFPNFLCEFVGGGRKINPSSKVSGPAWGTWHVPWGCPHPHFKDEQIE